MCLPIAPNTVHSIGREARLVSSKPLPWLNLYHHTAMSTDLRAPSILRDFSGATVVSMQDLTRMRRCWNRDEAERYELYQTASSPGCSKEKDSYPLPFCGPIAHADQDLEEDIAKEDEDEDATYSSSGDVHSDGASLEDAADALSDLFMRAILDVDERIPIIRDIEYDLSKIEHFDDPRLLFEEIAALKEYVIFVGSLDLLYSRTFFFCLAGSESPLRLERKKGSKNWNVVVSKPYLAYGAAAAKIPSLVPHLFALEVSLLPNSRRICSLHIIVAITVGKTLALAVDLTTTLIPSRRGKASRATHPRPSSFEKSWPDADDKPSNVLRRRKMWGIGRNLRRLMCRPCA
jgi:hypothetical protein